MRALIFRRMAALVSVSRRASPPHRTHSARVTAAPNALGARTAEYFMAAGHSGGGGIIRTPPSPCPLYWSPRLQQMVTAGPTPGHLLSIQARPASTESGGGRSATDPVQRSRIWRRGTDCDAASRWRGRPGEAGSGATGGGDGRLPNGCSEQAELYCGAVRNQSDSNGGVSRFVERHCLGFAVGIEHCEM